MLSTCQLLSTCQCKCQCLHMLVAALMLATAAIAQQVAANGFIPPPRKVPDFDPAAWNQAYTLTLRGVPASHSGRELLQSLWFPNTMLVGVQMPPECDKDGFDSIAASGAKLGSCFSKPAAAGVVDYWIKLPGLALVAGNCYCYALGFFQGGYCYPGTTNGAIDRYRQRMTCKDLSAGVVGDGGEQVSRQQALSGQPGSGHYIAIMARPESCIKGHCYQADFHALRKDSSGTWSWKHPGMPSTNRDLLGAHVTDPEAAALLGSYQVCGYFRVEPQKMLHVDAASRKEPGPLPVNPALEKYRALPGVKVEVTPLAYNPTTDDGITPKGQQVVDEDTAWERLRGSEQYEAWRIREKQALELLPRGVLVNDMAGSDSVSSSSSVSGSRAQGPKRHRCSRRVLQAQQQ